MSDVVVGAEAAATPLQLKRPSLLEMSRYFARLGTTGFGGPIALVGYMEDEFVDRRRWVTLEEFKEGLAFSQLAPGPLAAQLAIYLGWLCGGGVGATTAGIAFVGPSFAMVFVLAALYKQFGGIAWLQGAFYGVGAAVIAIVVRSAIKLARKTLATDWLLWLLFTITTVVTAWRESEIAWLFVACGIVSVVVRTGVSRNAFVFAPSLWSVTATSAATGIPLAATIFVFFASAGLFVFGSGLAIVPFLYDGVVQQRHWLTERQFLDAVAVALITPGPVVITVAFIGFLVGGALGAVAAAAGVFAPVFFITLIFAPHFDRLKSDRRVRAFVDGVTAAATGAIAGAAFVLGRRAIVDLSTAAVAIVALALTVRVRRLPEPLLIVGAGVIGVVLKGFR
jgi:chromate transporter